METFFSVSFNGVFVFRTDVFNNDPQGAFRAQQALFNTFGQLPGYAIECSSRAGTWTSSPVKVARVEPVAVRAQSDGVVLTKLERNVYEALVDNSFACSGGDFACAEEVDTKALKITKAQFGALLTTLQTKRVISVDVTYINGSYRSKGEKVTQVSFYFKDANDRPRYLNA